MAKLTEKELEDIWKKANDKMKWTFGMYDASATSDSVEAVRHPDDKERMATARRSLAMASALENARQQIEPLITELYSIIRKSNV